MQPYTPKALVGGLSAPKITMRYCLDVSEALEQLKALGLQFLKQLGGNCELCRNLGLAQGIEEAPNHDDASGGRAGPRGYTGT